MHGLMQNLSRYPRKQEFRGLIRVALDQPRVLEFPVAYLGDVGVFFDCVTVTPPIGGIAHPGQGVAAVEASSRSSKPTPGSVWPIVTVTGRGPIASIAAPGGAPFAPTNA